MKYVKIFSKATLTLKDLNSNAEKVLGRKHFRDRKITIKNVRYSAGVNSVTVKATSTGRDHDYNLNIIFYGVKSLDSPHRQFPLKVKVGKNKYKYFRKPKWSVHPVRFFCECPWTQWAGEWYLKEHDALQPKRKPRPYKRKTTWFPSPNPERLPVICKHGFQLALKLRDDGILIMK